MVILVEKVYAAAQAFIDTPEPEVCQHRHRPPRHAPHAQHHTYMITNSSRSLSPTSNSTSHPPTAPTLLPPSPSACARWWSRSASGGCASTSTNCPVRSMCYVGQLGRRLRQCAECCAVVLSVMQVFVTSSQATFPLSMRLRPRLPGIPPLCTHHSTAFSHALCFPR